MLVNVRKHIVQCVVCVNCMNALRRETVIATSTVTTQT